MVPTNMPAVSIDINMFWQIINFLILLVIFNKKFKAPLMKLLKTRQDKIVAEFSEANQNKEEAILKNNKAEQLLKEAREEATKIVQLAEKKSEIRSEEIISEAESQRDKMIKNAEIEIEKMKNAAQRDLKNEMNGLAVKLAEKIIKENLDSNLEVAIANKFIEEIGG